MGDIKEIFEALNNRIRSPLFGYFSLSFLAINWKAIFYLLVANTDVVSRIEYFECNTSVASLLWVPLAVSVALALGYPWIQVALVYATSAPVNRRNEFNARAESELLLIKIDLENKRNELIRQKEQQVIEKAKIDESIEGISSEEAREKARKEIQAIRTREEVLKLPLDENSLDRYLNDRYPNLPIDPDVKRLFLRDVNRRKYASIKDIEEVLEKAKGFVEYYKEKNPEVFKSSIDYVTKSFGFVDLEFRKKHSFSIVTLDAMDSYGDA